MGPRASSRKLKADDDDCFSYFVKDPSISQLRIRDCHQTKSKKSRPCSSEGYVYTYTCMHVCADLDRHMVRSIYTYRYTCAAYTCVHVHNHTHVHMDMHIHRFTLHWHHGQSNIQDLFSRIIPLRLGLWILDVPGGHTKPGFGPAESTSSISAAMGKWLMGNC